MKKKARKGPAKKTLPFWKQKWFLMLMGLAVVVVILSAPPAPSDPNVLGASTHRASLWDYISGFFGKKSSSQLNTTGQTSTVAVGETAASALLSNTSLPLGDGKYSTSPKKGYIYTCQTSFNGSGAFQDGPWINSTTKTWDSTKKVSVSGSHTWANAKFTITVSGDTRTLSGNGLPVNHGTGTFPIAMNDPAYSYDRNPNILKEQTINVNLPVNPTLLSTPQCIGGEVGVMLSGVPIFDGFDAGGRDAVAHEIQDSCGGHPQESGMYHYHGPSKCVQGKDGLLGYAFDGFGIYSPNENGKELTSNDLDECHGKTSEITWDGKKVVMYHYVMTKDFPYSVGCFRGKKMVSGPLTTGQGTGKVQQNGNQMKGPMPSGMRRPPSGQRPPPPQF